MYLCKYLNIPKVENRASFRLFSLARLFSLVVLIVVGLSFVAAAQTYEAKDEYRNLIFTLTLQPDQTYRLEERYLDGSIWVDSGKWVREHNEYILRSFDKTERKQNSLKFKKTLKFKGDTFLVEGDQLRYAKKGNYKLNQHYNELVIRELPPAMSPVHMAIE